VTVLDARTGTIRWSDSGGDRPTLILLHAMGADRTLWNPQLGALHRVRRVVNVDLPGHGASSAHPGPYTIEDLGMDILDVAAACGAANFDVCGISLGGLISLWLASNAPGAVSKLIACNTAARLGSERLWSERIEAVERGGMAAVRETVMSRFFAPGFELRYPGALASVRRVFAEIDPVGYAGCCAALRDADLTGAVAGIVSPTLIVGGALDVATPPEQSVWLHDRIPDSRVEVIPGAAHLSNLDQPDLFNGIVLDMLGGDR